MNINTTGTRRAGRTCRRAGRLRLGPGQGEGVGGPRGSSCREVVDRTFASVRFEGQALNACLAVLRLSRKYSSERLERACSMALASGRRSPRYRDVEPALRTGQDKGDEGRAGGAEQGGYVRGAGFYGED